MGWIGKNEINNGTNAAVLIIIIIIGVLITRT